MFLDSFHQSRTDVRGFVNQERFLQINAVFKLMMPDEKHLSSSDVSYRRATVLWCSTDC